MSNILKGLQLNELSNEKLAKYKTAAAADAKKADTEGDYKRGDKRFSGIVKATKKQFANDSKGITEMDSEGYKGSRDDYELGKGKEHTGKATTTDNMLKAAKKAWDYATEPVDAPNMETYKKHRAKNIANIRKNKEQDVKEAYNNYHANRTGFSRGQRDDERHDLDVPTQQIWGLKINGKVWSKGGKYVTFTSKQAALNARNSILKNKPDLEIGLVTQGGPSTAPASGAQIKTDDNFRNFLAQRKVGEEQLDEIIDPSTAAAKALRYVGRKFATAFPWLAVGGVGAGLAATGLMAPIVASMGGISTALSALSAEMAFSAGMAGTYAAPSIIQTIKDLFAADENSIQSGIKRWVEKYVGDDNDVQEFMLVHSKAAYEGKPGFRWRAKEWPVKMTREQAEAYLEKNDKSWLDYEKQKVIDAEKAKAEKEKADKEGNQELDENLHKWFKEKWVRFGPDGKIRGDCARGDDSEGKPKCLPQSKAHSLGKKGRASAASRKRREDPNPERSGKAINVNTKKKSNESVVIGRDEGNFAGDTPVNLGSVVVKNLTIGDIVSYLGQKAKILAMSKTGNTSRIHIPSSMGGVTKDVLTKDLKRTSLSEEELDEACWKGYHKEGNKKMFGKTYPNCVKNEGVAEGSLNEFAPDGFNGGDDGEEFNPNLAKMAQEDGFTKGASLADGATLQRAMAINDWDKHDGGIYSQHFAKGFKAGRMDKIRHNNKQYNLNLQLMKDGSIRHGEQGVAEDQHSESCPHCGGEMVSEELMNEKKDACYYKVKSRYKVWPSAYASGALVKCRKKGASNWGNGGKSNESIEEDDAGDVEQRMIAKIQKEKQRLAKLKQTDPEAYKREMAKRKTSGRVPPVSTFEDQGVAEGSGFDKWANDRAASQLHKLKRDHSKDKKANPAPVQQDNNGDWEQRQIEKMKKYRSPEQGVAEDQLDEKWSKKYKDSINCSNPKGFSQKAHCAGKQKNESSIMSGLNQLDEGWKEKLGAAALAGSMALGAGAAHSRVTPDGQGGFTGGLKPTATVTAHSDDKPAAEAPKGFSKEYLQKAADPNRTGRYMISVEKAQELLKGMQ